MFVNGTQELRFKSQSFTSIMESQLFYVGNFNINWVSAENPKTGLYGNVYDFAIDL